MKILLTGATGFLGKQVLQLLIDDERVSEIIVITRRKRQHESPKVRVAVFDLAGTSGFPGEISLEGLGCVIHLAGLYDFRADYQQCYQQNVLATVKLVWLLKDRDVSVPIHFASTYAVGCPRDGVFRETALDQLPSLSLPYAYSKALAEKILAESGCGARIFRFGILMGDSIHGEIEKLDGIYSTMEFFQKLAVKLPEKSRLRALPIPIPADPQTILPLVPVDTAARVLAASPFEGELPAGRSEYYGVYNPSSTSVSEVVSSLRDHILPGARVVYVRSRLPSSLLGLQEKLTGISPTTFVYANHPTRLDASRFEDRFPAIRIAPFSELKDCWIHGFEKYTDFRRE